jgi:hypothetical protein
MSTHMGRRSIQQDQFVKMLRQMADLVEQDLMFVDKVSIDVDQDVKIVRDYMGNTMHVTGAAIGTIIVEAKAPICTIQEVRAQPAISRNPMKLLGE